MRAPARKLESAQRARALRVTAMRATDPAPIPGRRAWRRTVAAALCACAAFAVVRRSDARVTRIEITRRESPAFGGTAFGDVGAYEKLVGRAFGEIDPGDPEQAVIADLAL